MDKEDVELSLAVLKKMERPPAPGGRWLNAFRAVSTAIEVLDGNFPGYVEGHTTVPGRPEDTHAWLETKDGRIIDVSLPWDELESKSATGTRHVVHRRFTLWELLNHLDHRDAVLPIGREEDRS